jgi:hypothetical protein
MAVGELGIEEIECGMSSVNHKCLRKLVGAVKTEDGGHLLMARGVRGEVIFPTHLSSISA